MPKKIVRSQNPEVLEFPFELLDSFITPNDLFFVRNHFPEPTIDLNTWHLKVEGAVNQQLELSYDDILALPAKKLAATLECAGNSRQFLVPPVKGVNWDLGGISNAEWTGVSLSTILERAGINETAVDVILEGADSGEVEEPPKPQGPIHFARSIPVAKAMQGDVLIAHQMNGQALTAAHGFPVRALVPGWYAVASVKWLQRIIVSDKRFEGYYETTDYAYWEDRDGIPVRVPISKMQMKAEIARPRKDEVLPCNSDYRVTGATWSGEEVAKVEISTDGGNTWSQANLIGQPVQYAWRLWEFNWRTPSSPGPVTMLARATDSKGNTQAMCHDKDHGAYLITHCLPITVMIQ